MAKKKTTDITPAAPVSEKKAAAPRRRALSKQATAETVVEASNDRAANSATDSAPTLVSAPDASVANRPTYDQIAEAAYLRYLSRGGGDGRDFDDWLAAEQELKTR